MWIKRLPVLWQRRGGNLPPQKNVGTTPCPIGVAAQMKWLPVGAKPKLARDVGDAHSMKLAVKRDVHSEPLARSQTPMLARRASPFCQPKQRFMSKGCCVLSMW